MKAEIDTSAPFGSVKEAVMMFGERVLAGEVYAPNKLFKFKNETNDHGTETIASELEETKQSVQKAREESYQMALCLSSLQEELEQTKRELHKLRSRHIVDLDIEDLKFVEEDSPSAGLLIEQVKKETTTSSTHDHQRKYVAFANPLVAVTRVVLPPPPPSSPPPPSHEADVLQRHPSLKKKKKKPLIPFIGGIFSRKRGSSGVAMA